MIRPWHTWLIFSVCVAILLAAMGWVSLTALRLERAEETAARQSAHEGNTRLALWRMDSALAPLIAQESARPYFVYSSFYPTERAYTRMFAEIERGEVLIPSPLLESTSTFILVHFQIEPDGTFTSPQVPTGSMRELAEAGYTTPEKIDASARRLAELESLISRDALAVALGPPAPATQPTPLAVLMPGQQPEAAQPTQQVAAQSAKPAQIEGQKRAARQQLQISIEQAGNVGVPGQTQAALNANSASARGLNYDTNTLVFSNDRGGIVFAPANVSENLARPVWLGDTLLLARYVSVNGGRYIQGCWLDWPAIRSWLIEEVHDLLPAATLEIVRSAPPPDETRMLAALPVRLDAGPLPPAPAGPRSPTRIMLLTAWLAVLLAAGAVAALLIGTVSLSERRAAFVSAVTHEMRTPLTTFRMYTEMLVKGMVPDEQNRRRYLETLRVEADRLSHLIANVLAYARLERTSPGARAEPIGLAELIERVDDRLAERAARADMTLSVDVTPGASQLTVRADPAAVEQILVNLVDNACKYAAPAEDRRIHLEAQRVDADAVLRVRDHGPGIHDGHTRRLFKPFGKSARDAANSAPGVGLGLALSRRLARNMNGTLRLDPSVTEGAAFVLTLPLQRVRE